MKKILSTAFFAFVALCSFAQKAKKNKKASEVKKTTYTIVGEMNGLDSAKVYISYMGADDEAIIDSSLVTKGTFTITKKIEKPVMGTFVLMTTDRSRRAIAPIFLERGTIKVVANVENIEALSITGTSYNNQYNNYHKQLNGGDPALVAKLQKKYQEAEAKNDTSAMESLVREYQTADSVNVVISKEFVTKNKPSLVSLHVFTRIFDRLSIAEIESVLEKFSNSKIADDAVYMQLVENFENMKKTAIGQMAQEIVQADVTGNSTIALSSLKGKYVLIDFWASWCGPCRAENPNVVEAYKRFKDKNFTIYSVSLDKSREKWLQAIKEDDLSWPYHVSDLKGWANEAAQAYSVKGIPANFLIDPTGKIIASNLRGEDLIKTLEAVLK